MRVAVIGGKVLGDVTARESLELQPKSELVGNVSTKNLVVGESAILDGFCDMGQKERRAKGAPEEKAKGAEKQPGSPASAGPSPARSGSPSASARRSSPSARIRLGSVSST